MTYEYVCDCCGAETVRHSRITNMLPESIVHYSCPEGKVDDDVFYSDEDIHHKVGIYRLKVTGGVGTIFVGGGWTPRGEVC